MRKLMLLTTLASLLAPAYALEGVVRVESGLLAGGGTRIRCYKGVPYAAPPVSPLRWQPPQPARLWTGIRMAREYGAICPQVPLLLPAEQSEDRLTLNIWTLAARANAKLPVMVWLYGGGFQAGASAQTVYDGEALAQQGVVLVTIDYRLGVFGFLAHPGLSRELAQGVSGNHDLLEQIAALHWVKRNI